VSYIGVSYIGVSYIGVSYIGVSYIGVSGLITDERGRVKPSLSIRERKVLQCVTGKEKVKG